MHGGDARLALSQPSQLNMYGCAPFPRTGLIDYASSTASSISQEAYDRVQAARRELLALNTAQDAASAFDIRVTAARAELAQLLGLEADTDIVFAASGTDAQLQALFLTKALLDAPLTTIIVGADQTGSGTANTSRGQHFGDVTAGGQPVGRGRPIEGVAEQVASIEIPFRNEEGGFRTPDEMDRAVMQAILQAINADSTVLLQIMDALKARLAGAQRCFVSKRLRAAGPARCRSWWMPVSQFLARLAIGWSECWPRASWFCSPARNFSPGPPFSGALLVPRLAVGENRQPSKPEPGGLSAYTTRYDWPAGWTWLRDTLYARPNFSPMAALAAGGLRKKMRLYYAVPDEFCVHTRRLLAEQIDRSIAASPHLKALPAVPGTNEITIFAAMPHRNGENLSLESSTEIYRAMERDCSAWLAETATDAECRAMSQPCQIGQPVALPDGAALRLSISARTIRRCWSRRALKIARQRIAEEIENCRLLFAKLNFLIGQRQESRAPGTEARPFLLEEKWDDSYPARLGLAWHVARGGTCSA